MYQSGATGRGAARPRFDGTARLWESIQPAASWLGIHETLAESCTLFFLVSHSTLQPVFFFFCFSPFFSLLVFLLFSLFVFLVPFLRL